MTNIKHKISELVPSALPFLKKKKKKEEEEEKKHVID